MPENNNLQGTLTPSQMEKLRTLCNKMPVQQIISLIDTDRIKWPDDLDGHISDERKTYINQILDSRPNPHEQAEWKALEPMLRKHLDELLDGELRSLQQGVEQYVAHWQNTLPPENHIDEAESYRQVIQAEVVRRNGIAEREEWERVDKADAVALMAYLHSHPQSAFASEIDDFLWATVEAPGNPNVVNAAQQYRNAFPSGKHQVESVSLVREYAEWMSVKADRDIFAVRDYMNQHIGGRYYSDAMELFMNLKEYERERMRTEASSYSREFLSNLRRGGIFTDEELVSAGVHSYESLRILDHYEELSEGLPDIQMEIANCRSECAMDCTDVFFWGIPATGKSCILMGLIGSRRFSVNYVVSGGPYAAALSQYLEAGCTIGQTPGEFVATIQASIHDTNGIYHGLNLVEMAGETFAFKVANNPEREVSLSDMGNGTAELLSNNNRKVFFLIIDPTAESVSFNHFVNTPEGRRLVKTNVNQRITLNKMINLMEMPQNEEIMKKVDYLHIIVTKADELAADYDSRNNKALELFQSKYDRLLEPIQRLCKKYGINRSTNGAPLLYTFSLGNFYAGGIYQYNDHDSNKLANLLSQTIGKREQTFWDRFRNAVN